MGLFGKKERKPILCNVCSKEIKGVKRKIKDGVICSECFLEAGYLPGDLAKNRWEENIKDQTVASLSEQVKAKNRFVNTSLIALYKSGLPGVDSSGILCSLTLSNDELVIVTGSQWQLPPPLSQPDMQLMKLSEQQKKGEAVQSLTYRIPYDRVLAIDLITTQTFKEKNKSVVGRSIAGGFLFGPTGAVIGGMTGLGTKSIAINMAFFVVAYTDKNNEIQNIVFFG